MASFPGIPNAPDLVTVVPFYHKDNETALEQTKVVIPAEVDGKHGIFVVDLGAPTFNLNRTFLQPNPSGGVDTVTDANRIPERGRPDSVHVTVRIGTLTTTVVDPTVAPDDPRHTNASLNHMWGNYSWVFAPRLGNIGLSVLDPFETIIDYTHRRLVLIRLDTAGRRLAAVPAYTPQWTAPMVDLQFDGYGKMRFWGLRVLLGGVPDSVLFDTGNPDNTLTQRAATQAAAHLANGTLDHLVVAGRSFDAVPFNVTDDNVLGYPFLSQLGVVGFNHRTHQLILYR